MIGAPIDVLVDLWRIRFGNACMSMHQLEAYRSCGNDWPYVAKLLWANGKLESGYQSVGPGRFQLKE